MTPNGTYASPKNKPLIRRRKTSGKEGGNKTHKEGNNNNNNKNNNKPSKSIYRETICENMRKLIREGSCTFLVLHY